MLRGGEGCENMFGRKGDGCAGIADVLSKVIRESLTGSPEGEEEGGCRSLGEGHSRQREWQV